MPIRAIDIAYLFDFLDFDQKHKAPLKITILAVSSLNKSSQTAIYFQKGNNICE